MADDVFAGRDIDLDSPADHAAAITPNDSTDLAKSTRSIWVGGAGNVELVTVSGETVTFSGAAAGSIIPIRAQRVRATGTTATNLVGMW